jgi:hypothetical protein
MKAIEDSEFCQDLRSALNRRCRENASNTPDFILTGFLAGCLDAFDSACGDRDRFFNVTPSIVNITKDGKREPVYTCRCRNSALAKLLLRGGSAFCPDCGRKLSDMMEEFFGPGPHIDTEPDGKDKS